MDILNMLAEARSINDRRGQKQAIGKGEACGQ